MEGDCFFFRMMLTISAPMRPWFVAELALKANPLTGPFEMRVQDEANGAQNVGTLEAIRAKILVEESHGSLEAVQVELTRCVGIYSSTLFAQCRR